MTSGVTSAAYRQNACVYRLASICLSALFFAADLNLVLSQESKNTSLEGFTIEQKEDRLLINLDGKSLGSYVFRDSKILRPYFCNLQTPSGKRVTRNHPPVEGIDAVDHATMHPGIWLAFGDINGYDFWRNKASIEHEKFTMQPSVAKAEFRFASASNLIAATGGKIGTINSTIRLNRCPSGVLLTWQADFNPIDQPLVFGDQEEMGFGVRLATELTEKSGGLILSSDSRRSAKETWGQEAKWCEYSKNVDGKKTGITVMTSPANFRPSWWHNRDYGLMVANPFGRAAMKRGEPSKTVVSVGQKLRIGFAAMIHEDSEYLPAEGYEQYLKLEAR